MGGRQAGDKQAELRGGVVLCGNPYMTRLNVRLCRCADVRWLSGAL